jgi:hypothetical protein
MTSVCETRTNLEDVGSIIDQLPALEVRGSFEKCFRWCLWSAVFSEKAIALRKNPCTKPSSSRRRLLGAIKNLRTLQCPLRILDKPISMNERLEAWMADGGTEVCLKV